MPVQRNAANARERARMRVLSSAFCRLKTKLPWVPPDTKLSKLDTLRLAKGYIQQLEAILAGEPIEDNLHMASNQQNLVRTIEGGPKRVYPLRGGFIVHRKWQIRRF